MKSYSYTEIFQRYVDDQCTAEEIKLLLQHFNLEQETGLADLVEQELQKPLQENFDTNAAVQATFSRVHQSLLNKIQDHVQPQPAKIVLLHPKVWVRLAIAASVLLIGTAGLLNFNAIMNWVSPVTFQKLETANGQRKQISLEDGTQIWLNPQSSITYPDHFRGKTREVSLKGEAFFEVAKDKKHPFIVHSGQVNTQVLGTSFNIRSYVSQPSIKITLLTGRVAVRLEHAKNNLPAAEITPNQQVTYDKATGTIAEHDFPEAAQFLARREGKLIYKGTALTEVVNDLQLFYNIRVTLPGNMHNCLFYGNINIVDDPLLAMQQIALTFNGSFTKIDNHTYTISKGQCSK